MATKMKAKPKSKAAKLIREGDTVFVLAGNDKGRTGKVLARVGNERAVVEGINIKTKHVKAQQGQQGEIVKMEAPINISNLKLCIDEKKPVKVKVEMSENGQKDLVYDDGGKQKVYRTLRKSKS